jgi:hypothetical protein
MLIPKSSNPVKPKLTWRERAIAFLAPEEKPKLEARAAERERVAAEETAARAKIAAKEAHIDLHKRAFENAWGRPMGERELAKLHGQIKAQEDMNDVGPMLDRISPRTGDYRGQVDQLNRAAVDLQRAANAGFKQT